MSECFIKFCKKHGETEFVRRSDGRCRCKKCAIEAVTKRRDKVKKVAVDYKGGKCCVCGYDKCLSALDFHHLDPNEKEFGIGEKGYTRSIDSIKKEVDKCVLVCANHHREIHAGLIDPFDYVDESIRKKYSKKNIDDVNTDETNINDKDQVSLF